MRAVIIDDVPSAIESLIQDINDYCPEISIAGTANSVVSGAKLVQTAKPELIFLDIEMEDGDGFDLLDVIGGADAHVIITSGSRDYAIKAFKYAAVDYLLKPIDPDELVNAVGKISTDPISQHKSKIALHTADQIYYAAFPAIHYCKADGNYTTFYLEHGQKIMVTRTLKYFEAKLPEDHFLRVHQSYLVNMDHVTAFLKEDGGYLLLREGQKIPVSVRKKTLVMEFINQRL